MAFGGPIFATQLSIDAGRIKERMFSWGGVYLD
jgi:hypothetical protein